MITHPLIPEQRAVTPQDLSWLLGAMLLVVAPHMMRAPWWLVVLTLFLFAWRGYFALNPGPLPSRWLVLAFALMGMVGIWLEARTLFGRTPGVLLLMLFAGLKLLETRTHRDASMATFLGFFLIITNFLYTQSIPTALLMCVAVVVLTTTLVGFNAPQRPVRANVRTAGLVLLHAAPIALVLFVLFPRVQGPLWGLPQDAYTGQSGLSDTMAPGNLSRLVLSDATAFRVEFQGEAPAQRFLYWRGPVLWDFDGRTWLPGPQMLADYEPPEGGTRQRYAVVLEPHNRHWLFALETAASVPAQARASVDGQMIALQPVRARVRYELESRLDPAPQPEEEPGLLRRALRLPPGFNPRARALAEEWRAASAGDEEIVARAVAYMRAGRYQYTLEPALLGEHSVDDFLFSTREGFCEHFSSAFAFLMRAAGVPARVVMGYQGGDVNAVDGILTVRQSDAHAWTEVFLRARGWVRIDPTVASNPARLESGVARSVRNPDSLPFLSRTDFRWLVGARAQWEALAHRWNVWVLGYNPERQRQFMRFVGFPDADWRSLTATLFTILGLITAGLLAWSLRRLARPDPVQQLWSRFCRKLAARGVERLPSEGPRDFSERAARALPVSRMPILQIGALYVQLRYGAETSAPERTAGIADLKRQVRELGLG